MSLTHEYDYENWHDENGCTHDPCPWCLYELELQEIKEQEEELQ